MKLFKKILLILYIIFLSVCIFAAPKVRISNFKINQKKISLNFNLRSVANNELISLILNSQPVRIQYKVSVYKKRGIFRKNKKTTKDRILNVIIKYNSFSRVFTVLYIFDKLKRKKRFVRSRNNRKTIKLILKHFFNKEYFLQIKINKLNRRKHDYLLKIIAKINSVKLAPPYNIINSSFNFQIEETRSF